MHNYPKPQLRRVGERESEPPKEESALPWWMLGMGAALGGVGATLRAGLSSNDDSRIRDFLDLKNKAYPDTEGGYLQRAKDYVEKGQAASTTHFFGATAGDVLKVLRQNPIAKSLNVGWEPGSEEHYRSFAASPSEAYLKRTGELAEYLFDPESADPYMASHMRDAIGDQGAVTYGDFLTKKLHNSFPKDISPRTVLSQLRTALETSNPAPNEVPIGGAFDTQLLEANPRLAAAKRTLDLNSGLHSRVADPVSYYAMVEPLLEARKYLPWIGGGLALGGAGWLLYRYLAKKREEEKARVAELEAGAPPEVDLRKAAAFFEGALGVLELALEKKASRHPAAFYLGFVNTLGNVGSL